MLTLVLSCGVFAPTLMNGFTFDDPHYARTKTPTGERNPMVAELRPFHEYWQKPMNWGLATNCRGFRPVTIYSYAAVNAGFASDREEGKGDASAWAHHLLNLLLHTFATGLVFLAVRSLLSTNPALIAALVFGVHGVHSGPVAAIVGRAELLAFTFGCSAMLLFTAALSLRGSAWLRRIGGSAVLAMLAFGSKESALAWAAFIPLYAWARGFSWRDQLVPFGIAVLIPLLAFVALRGETLAAHVEPRGPFWVEYDANPLYYLPTVERIINAATILVYAIGKILLPTNLSSMYGDGPFTIISSVFHWRFLLSSLFLVTLLVTCLHARRRDPVFFLAGAAFFGFTFITSNIPFPLESIFGERLLYTPVLALALIVARVAALLPRPNHLWLATALSAWVVWNAYTSVERSLAWHDNMTLTTVDVRNQPMSVGLHVDMGNLHLWNFDSAAGKREFAAALRVNPQSARALRFLAEHSQAADAEKLLRRALASPCLVPATEGRRVHWALAKLHEAADRPEAAWREYELALACNPFVHDIRLHMLRELMRRDEFRRFAKLLEAGQKHDAENPFLLMYEGVLRHRRGDHRAAVKAFDEALPDLPEQLFVVESWLCFADSLMHLGRDERARKIAIRFQSVAAEHRRLAQQCDRILDVTAANPGR